MKRFIFVFFTLSTFGCNNSNNKNTQKPSDEAENLKLRSVLIDKTQCDLIGNFMHTHVDDLQGVWADTLIWKKQSKDGCYFGFEELDRHITLEINPSKTFVWSEDFTVSERDFKKFGEFFLTNENNYTSLLIAENGKRDSISMHGDTLRAISYRLFWTDSTRFFLLPPNPLDNDYRYHEVIEFYKVD